MLQVVRVVVHGILFGLVNLQLDFIQRIWQTFLLEDADKWSAIPLPATMLQHASRTAEAAEGSISIEAALATLRAFDTEKRPISCTNIYFILVSYSLTSELWSSGPTEAAHVGGGDPFKPW